MERISKNEFAQLRDKVITLKKVYWPKRKWWNPWKNTFEEFAFVDNNWKKVERQDGKRNLVNGEVSYSIHKKKYDLVVEVPEQITIKSRVYNRDTKSKEVVELTDNEFTISDVSATLFGDLLAATIAFGKVPVDENEKRVFDWEEKFISECNGISFNISPEKKEMKWDDWTVRPYYDYIFKEAKTPVKRDIDEEWVAEVEEILGKKDEPKDEIDELF